MPKLKRDILGDFQTLWKCLNFDRDLLGLLQGWPDFSSTLLDFLNVLETLEKENGNKKPKDLKGHDKTFPIKRWPGPIMLSLLP